MSLKRMDNVGIVVEDLGGAIEFFRELGLGLEGRATIEGEWAGRVTGLSGQCAEIAMMRTPDGHSRLELCRFLTPAPVADHRKAPVNSPGSARNWWAKWSSTKTPTGSVTSVVRNGFSSGLPRN